MSIQKKMGDLLLKGATMLDKYCPECKNILFKLVNKDIYCPSCEKKIIIIEDNENSTKREHLKNRETEIKNFSKMNIENVLIGKLDFLIKKLESTEDLFIIEKIIINIEKLLYILKILE